MFLPSACSCFVNTASLLGEIEADPMSTTLGATGRKPHFKRSATASAIAAARPSMPSFKPGSARVDRSLDGGIRDCRHLEGGDYSRAPPSLAGGMPEWDEDEMVGLSPAPDAAIISRRFAPPPPPPPHACTVRHSHSTTAIWLHPCCPCTLVYELESTR